jgi:hypothetical protein
LTCQAILNDPEVENFAESFGSDLQRPHAFNERLRALASTRVRFLLDDLIHDKEYEAKTLEGNYSFMRSSEAFKKAMKHAARRDWEWKTILLR